MEQQRALMFVGYNTNGLPGHRLEDAIPLLAEIGYRGVAITLDHHALSPFDDALDAQLDRVAALLHEHKLTSVIETGARYLLDPRCKHQPTLLSDDPAARRLRIDLILRAVEIARRLGSTCVSFWSGAPDRPLSDDAGFARLADSIRPVLTRADDLDVPLAFEPEPGMFIDTLDRFARLDAMIAHPRFQLTLDVGHVLCTETISIAEAVRRWGPRILNVHIEDMRRAHHEHLAFGEGEIDFAEVIGAFREMNYCGGLFVELPRHAHDAVRVACQSFLFLSPLLAR